MKDRVITMSNRSNFLTDTEHKAAREQFDKQHTELQVAMEKMCRKFKLGKTDYRPLWAAVDKKQKIYKWTEDAKRRTKKPKDMRNLERACQNNKISCPHKMTLF